MTDLVFRARRVLTPGGMLAAEVRVRDGVIVSVDELASAEVTETGGTRGVDGFTGDGRTDGAKVVVLADDEVLIPGLVDTHVHVNEPGRTDWEGFATAAAGGVTTIIDMPLNSIPPTVDSTGLAAKRKAAAGNCAVDVGFWGGAVPGNRDQRASLHEAGVFGFKCFTVDSGVPEFPPLDDAGLAQAVRQVAELGSVLVVHAEEAAVLATAPTAGGRGHRANRAYLDFLASRPGEAEVGAIRRLVELARDTGARVHVLHLSAASAVPLLAAAQADGVLITAETCPHYLALGAEQVRDGQTQFKCCPPIRDRANQELLWEALETGVIGCVVSDHSPCPPELKHQETGDFAAAWGGISSLQLGLPVTWTRAARRGHDLADVLTWMAANPARLAGLDRKGSIEPGRDADLVAFAPDETFVLTPDRLRTRHRLTPYEGQELRGVVRKTWLRGVEAGAGQPAGRLLTRVDLAR
jgi:allantoinase